MRVEPYGAAGVSRLVTDEVTGQAAAVGLSIEPEAGDEWRFTVGVPLQLDDGREGVSAVLTVPLEDAEELILEMLGVVARARRWVADGAGS